ncbi:MAG: DUF3352 domain-containing protein [Aeromicrobium sp.]|uniref:DUF3352 domain-containing protein n=1 Tax=Aeromicrobium sp. TaxID=1871063 RepID=UPI0039E6F1FB
MSESLPPPPGPSGMLPPPPVDTAPAAGGAAAAGGGGGAALKIGAGVVGLALVGGGAFGAKVLWDNTLGGGGPQPADALPASTVAYARIDLDPSASQKVALLDLIDRVPEVKEEFGLEDVDSQADLREVAFTDWFDIEGSCDVDYDADVKPWIGERAGIALIGDFEISDDEQDTAQSVAENTALVIQVTDEDKAREGITKLATECGVMDDLADGLDLDNEEPGIVFRDGFAVVAVSQEAADAIDQATSDKGTLASNDRFSADMDALGEDGIFSAWYDERTLMGKVDEALDEFGDDVPDDVHDMVQAYSKVESAAFTIRASEESLEAAGVTTLEDGFETPDADSLAGLPADTLVGVSIVGGGQWIEEGWDSFAPMAELYLLDSYACPYYDDYEYGYDYTCEPPSFDDMVDDFESETGLKVPDDLATLLGTEFNLYVGSEGVEDLKNADDEAEALETLNAGIEITSDGDVAGVLEDLMDFAGADLDITETDGGAIIATNDDAAETLESDDGLGESETFSSVISQQDNPMGGVYVDIAGVIDALKSFDAIDTGDADDLAFLKAFGLTTWQESDNVIGFSAKLSFNPADSE